MTSSRGEKGWEEGEGVWLGKGNRREVEEEM